MRTFLLMFFAMLFFMGSSATLAAAQDDATPEGADAEEAEEAPEGSNPVDPKIGDAVTYYGQNGEPVGTITVTEIVRGWEDYGEFEEPSPGVEYVAFTIEVESTTSRGSINVGPFDFILQTAAGFGYDTSFVSGADDLEPAVLEDTDLAGGETLEALIVFEVFEAEPLAHLFWNPEGAFLTVAQLEGE